LEYMYENYKYFIMCVDMNDRQRIVLFLNCHIVSQVKNVHMMEAKPFYLYLEGSFMDSSCNCFGWL
jgi:hypothetical protein